MNCPQCRSDKTIQNDIFSKAKCEYCGNEFYPQTLDDLYKHFKSKTEVFLPNFKRPLSISSVSKEDGNLQIGLEGVQGGEYRLLVYPIRKGVLRRRKSPSERNQFGSRWKTVNDSIWPIQSQ